MGKATKVIVARRIEEVLRIRLDGAEFWDVLQYIAEKQQAGEEPWKLPDGGKPIAERTIWWYIGRADQLLKDAFRKEAGRKRLLRRHLAQRRNLFAKAVGQGDIRAALACLDSEAKLTGLFEDELNRIVEKLQKEIAEIKGRGNSTPPKTDSPAAEGCDSTPDHGAGDPEPYPQQSEHPHGMPRSEARRLATEAADDLLADDMPPLFGGPDDVAL